MITPKIFAKLLKKHIRHIKYTNTNRWYYFKNFKWNYCVGTQKIKNHIFDNIINSPNNLKLNYPIMVSLFNDILNFIDFKNDIINECKDIYYDKDFESMLDSKHHLICFENGAYDLEKMQFIGRCPNNYCSLSTGYDYEEYNSDHGDVLAVEKFFDEVLGDDKNNFLINIAKCLHGSKKGNLNIWHGSGSNGKSTVLKLCELAFGQYFRSEYNCFPENINFRGVRIVSLNGDITKMLQLSIPDVMVTKELYSKPFQYRPQFSIITCTNKNISNDKLDNVISFKNEFVDTVTKNNQYLKNINIIDNVTNWKKPFMWLLINKYYKMETIDNVNTNINNNDNMLREINELTNKYKELTQKYDDIGNKYIKLLEMFVKEKLK